MRVEVLTRSWTARSSFWLAGVLLFTVSLLPPLYMFVHSFGVEGHFTLSPYARLLGESRQRQLLGNSVRLAAWAALVGSALGAPAGLALARLPQAAALPWRFALLLPLVLPPYILGVVWVFVLGRAGLVGRLLGNDVASAWAYSLAGAGMVLGIAFAPLAMLLAEAARRAIPPRLIESGSWRSPGDSLVAARPQIATTIFLSLVGATLATGLGLLLGYWRARTLSRWRTLFDLSLLALFAVPSTVVGIGLIGLWNRPGWPGAVYISPMIIILGYLARYVPIAALLLGAYLRQLPASREEAALVFGASWGRMLGRIVIPSAWPGLTAIWTICFIWMFGELGTTVLVAPPGTTTLPVRVYALLANSPERRTAALCLMQTLVILLSLGGLLLVLHTGRRRPPKRGRTTG